MAERIILDEILAAARETAPDYVLGIEEARDAMRQLVGQEGTETARKEDERGLYLLERTVEKENGENVEYAYRRKGNFKEYQTAITTIEAVFYGADGIPEGGKTVANWIDGAWVRQD